MMKHHDISRRLFLAGAGGTVAASVLPQAGRAASSEYPVVVELFTSQGCSSCPPADAFMGELAKRRDVVGLTYNVDYWDYLGWRDTLGSPAYSKRQRDYAMQRSDGRVYTPQMVLDGRIHEVGSRKNAVLAAIEAESRDRPKNAVSLSVVRQGDDIILTAEAAPNDGLRHEAGLWLAMVSPEVSVAIGRGENTGRKITYYNVVRRLVPVGKWHGDKVSAKVAVSELKANKATTCAALLQPGHGGPVLGAAMLGGTV